MSPRGLEHAVAIARSGRLQEADGLADEAVDRALEDQDHDALLAWAPLSVELCDALGRPKRAVHVLSVAAAVCRWRRDDSNATALEVDAALRAARAHLQGWEARLEQALSRLVDEGASGWSLESVLGFFEEARTLERPRWVAEAAWALSMRWGTVRAARDSSRLTAYAASELESAGLLTLAIQAWEAACEQAREGYFDELEEWEERRERCSGRLLSDG